MTARNSHGIVRYMSTTAPTVIPGPTPDRISELRASLDPTQPDSFASFGAEAEAAIDAARAPLAQADASRISQDARTDLDQIATTARALDPHGLIPRRGLAGLFDSRGGRLKRTREAFLNVDRQLAQSAGNLKARASALTARATQLDPAQEAIRQPIVDLGAWIEAGRQRLSDAAAEAAEGEIAPRARLSERLEGLAAKRMSALAHLPLARVMQNADVVAAARLEEASAAIETWRADWRKGLGLDGKRKRKVQPDPAEMAALTTRLTRALDRAGQALSDGTARRKAAEGRLAAFTAAVGPRADAE